MFIAFCDGKNKLRCGRFRNATKSSVKFSERLLTTLFPFDVEVIANKLVDL